MRHDLTTRQQKILDFITEFQTANGYAPTVREIADGVGLASTSTAHGHLDRLERAGRIKRKKDSPRAIKII